MIKLFSYLEYINIVNISILMYVNVFSFGKF